MKNKNLCILAVVILILVGVIFYGAYRLQYYKDHLESKTDIIESLQNTIRIKENESRIIRYEGVTKEDLLSLRSNDSVLIQLQNSIKKYEKEISKVNSSITAIQGNTHTITKVPTIVEVPVVGDYPIYRSIDSTKWYQVSTVATKDSILNDIKFINKHNVVLGYEKVGLFKYKPFVAVEDLNPYSQTTGLQSYSVTDKGKPKVSLGYHIGIGGQYGLIHKRLDFGPQGGVSINIQF